MNPVYPDSTPDLVSEINAYRVRSPYGRLAGKLSFNNEDGGPDLNRIAVVKLLMLLSRKITSSTEGKFDKHLTEFFNSDTTPQALKAPAFQKLPLDVYDLVCEVLHRPNSICYKALDCDTKICKSEKKDSTLDRMLFDAGVRIFSEHVTETIPAERKRPNGTTDTKPQNSVQTQGKVSTTQPKKRPLITRLNVRDTEVEAIVADDNRQITDRSAKALVDDNRQITDRSAKALVDDNRQITDRSAKALVDISIADTVAFMQQPHQQQTTTEALFSWWYLKPLSEMILVDETIKDYVPLPPIGVGIKEAHIQQVLEILLHRFNLVVNKIESQISLMAVVNPNFFDNIVFQKLKQIVKDLTTLHTQISAIPVPTYDCQVKQPILQRVRSLTVRTIGPEVDVIIVNGRTYHLQPHVSST
jgi:hypothetical protein